LKKMRMSHQYNYYKNSFYFIKQFCKKRVTLLFIMLILFNAANSQTTDLHQLLEKGKENYPLLKAKQSEVKSSERNISSAQTEYLPNLTLGHQYTYSTSNNVEGAFFPNEGTALSPSGGIRPDNIYKGAFGSFTSALLDWKIVNFGKVAANVNAVKAENKKAEADYQNELFQYQVRLTDAYLLLLISNHLTKVQQHNLQRAEASRNTIHARVNAGLRPGVDSSLANAEYIKAKLLLLESEKNERAYQYRLDELLGGGSDSIAIDTMNFFSDFPDPVSLSAQNLANAPSLRFHQSNIDLSRARSIAIKRSFYPSISFVGSVWARGSGISNKDQSYRTDFASGVDYQVYNYLTGLALRWNLTNYVRIRNDYKSEQFQIDRYKYLYESQYQKQTRELSEAEIQFNVSLQQALLAPQQEDASVQAFAQAKARYESGLTDLPTFTQSLVTLNRAEADTYIAYSNAWRALLMKAAAAGDLSLFLNQVK
jgi:outer membrane protein TolC